MKNKGFTLIELLATIVIISIVMGIVLPSALKVSRENQKKIYGEYEKMMVEYALVSEQRGRYIINLNNLEGRDAIKKDCIGYVRRISLDPLKYKAYIKCGDNYTTSGYVNNNAG